MAFHTNKFRSKVPFTSSTRRSSAEDLLGTLVAAQKSGEFTDVTFIFPNSRQEVKAHKLVLCLTSPVFARMLSNWGESTIEITDVDQESFNLFLKSLYTSRLPNYLPIENLIKLTYAANKYDVPDIFLQAVEELKSSITLESVLSILKTALLFEISDLEAQCWECIELDTDRLVLLDEFASEEPLIISKILQRGSLSVNEVQLFNALVRWGEERCRISELEITPMNIRKMLGELIFHIRFPTIDAQKFVDGPAASGLLTKEEIANIMITKFGSLSVSKEPNKFSPIARNPRSVHRLECGCRRKNIDCFYCKTLGKTGIVDIQPNSPNSAKKSFTIMPRAPINYCSCKMREYCPSKTII